MADWVKFKDKSPPPGKKITIKRGKNGIELTGAYTRGWVWVTLLKEGEELIVVVPTHWKTLNQQPCTTYTD